MNRVMTAVKKTAQGVPHVRGDEPPFGAGR